MMIMNKMLDMFVDADIFIHARMDGFLVPPDLNPAFNLNAPKEELNRVYANIESQRVIVTRSTIQMAISARTTVRYRIASFPDFLEPPCLMFDREVGHTALQPEILNPAAIQMEAWVRDQTESKVEKFSFVIYRLSYTESNDEMNGPTSYLNCKMVLIADGKVLLEPWRSQVNLCFTGLMEVRREFLTGTSLLPERKHPISCR